MRTEIERKYLVTGDHWRDSAEAKPIRQGYLCSSKDRSVRVRITGDRAYLTVKGSQVGATRAEYEYEVPVTEASEMLDRLCQRPLIEKTRYTLLHGGLEWEVDVFEGENAGLVVAEVELESESQAIDLPDWVGPEVTQDPRYLNANLSKAPFTRWSLTASSDV